MSSANLTTSPLHPDYGVRVHDVQLKELIGGEGYAMIRALFEEHSLLYFSDQVFSDEDHLALGSYFGVREDRSLDADNPDPEVSLVSNIKTDGGLLQPGERLLLNLQSNMLWHTDSIFLPVPALTNILVGRVIPPSGTATEFASTRASFNDLPQERKDRLRSLCFRHDYAHSRRKIDLGLAAEKKSTHWGEQVWRAIWKNPVNGREALYFASHTCGAVGMEDRAALAMIDELMAFCTRPEYVYRHDWSVGDVLIWDERAMLHRGVPWNYDEPRCLSSICVSVEKEDGFETMKYAGQARHTDDRRRNSGLT